MIEICLEKSAPVLALWRAGSGPKRGGKGGAEDYDLVTSAAVLDELAGGIPGRAAKGLALVRDLALLSVDSAIAEIVQAYIRHKLMPADPAGDALHLALVSHHKCDFLVTWNCQHLADANKFGHIRRANAMLGLFVPAW